MSTRMTGSSLAGAGSLRLTGGAQDRVDIAGLEPLKTFRSRWPAIIGAVLTLAMIAGLARELFGHGLAGLTRSVPADPRC